MSRLTTRFCPPFLVALWGLLAAGQTGFAQSTAAPNYCVSPPAGVAAGGFALSQGDVCQGRAVTITSEKAGLTQVRYEFEYVGAGLPAGNAAREYTYARAGQYTVLQRSLSGTQPAVACRSVNVLTTASLAFSVASCADQLATLTLLPDALSSAYPQVLIAWGDGSQATLPVTAAPFTHRYAQAGSYVISVTGRHPGAADCVAARASQQTLAVPAQGATLPYVSRVLGLDEQTLELSIRGQPGQRYELWRAPAGSPLTSSGSRVTDGDNLPIAVQANQSVCFQLRGTGSCAQPLASPVVCSLAPAVTAHDKHNALSWQAYQGTGPFGGWQLYRNGATVPVNWPSDPATNRTDDYEPIECGADYCYQLVAQAGATRIISYETCVKGQNSATPPAPQPIYVTLEGRQQSYVQATLPRLSTTDQFTISVSRADSPADPYKQLATLSLQFAYRDASVDFTKQSYCYHVDYRNRCGMVSPPSAPACTLWLSSTSAQGISWSSLSPFGADPVVSYSVLIYHRQTGQLLVERPLGPAFSYDPDPNDPALATYEYRIAATGPAGVRSFSNFYQFQPRPAVYIPTAFTPNGDGTNDTFELKGGLIKTYELLIYDRWGSVVFRSAEMSLSWDGTISGQPAPAGQYAYRVNIVSQFEQPHQYQGQLALIR